MELLAALMAGASAAWERRRGPCGCHSCRDQHGQAEHEPKQQRLLLDISLRYPILETWRREKAIALPLSPVGTTGREAEGGSEAQRLFCCVNTHLVSPCTTRHFPTQVLGRGPSPSSAPLIIPAHSSSPFLPTDVSQDPQHLGHRTRGARRGFAGNHQGLAAR